MKFLPSFILTISMAGFLATTYIPGLYSLDGIDYVRAIAGGALGILATLWAIKKDQQEQRKEWEAKRPRWIAEILPPER